MRLDMIPILYLRQDTIPILYLRLNMIPILYPRLNMTPTLYLRLDIVPILYLRLNMTPILYLRLDMIPIFSTCKSNLTWKVTGLLPWTFLFITARNLPHHIYGIKLETSCPALICPCLSRQDH